MAKFTGVNAVGDSLLTDNGTTLSYGTGGAFNVNNSTGFVGFNTSGLTGGVPESRFNVVASSVNDIEFVRVPGAPQINFKRVPGTFSSPTALANTGGIFQLAINSYDGTAFSGNQVVETWSAAENWSVGAHGTFWSIKNIPRTTTTPVPVMYIDSVGGQLIPWKGSVGPDSCCSTDLPWGWELVKNDVGLVPTAPGSTNQGAALIYNDGTVDSTTGAFETYTLQLKNDRTNITAGTNLYTNTILGIDVQNNTANQVNQAIEVENGEGNPVYKLFADGTSTQWGMATLTGGFTLGADSSAASHKITNLTNGSSAQDAAAFGQIGTAVNAAVSGTSGRSARFTGTNVVGDGAMSDTGTLVTAANDDSYLAWDTGGNARLGFTKKSATNPRVAYGSGISFAIAQSSAADIGAANTFTDRFTLDTSGNGTFSQNLTVSGNAVLASSSGMAVRIGRDTTTSTDAENGFRIVPSSDGSVYVDTKTITGGFVRFRGGSGAEPGSTRTWLTVTPSTRAAAFAGTLDASGLLTATAGVTTPANLTTTGSGDLVSGDALTVANNATLGDSNSDSHTINGSVTQADDGAIYSGTSTLSARSTSLTGAWTRTLSGTLDTTSGALTAEAGRYVVNATRVSGSGTLTNRALWLDASGGQAGIALETNRGDVYLNASNGSTGIGYASGASLPQKFSVSGSISATSAIILAGSLTAGDSTTSDSHTINGTLSAVAAGTTANDYSFTDSATGSTITKGVILVQRTGSSDATSGIVTNNGVNSVVSATKSAGANAVRNNAFRADASGGDQNVAYLSINGDNMMNTSSGSMGVGYSVGVTLPAKLAVNGTALITGNTTLGTATTTIHVTDTDGSARPTLSGCGLGAAVVGNDHSGKITLPNIETPDTCVMTFNTAYSTKLSCTLTARDGVPRAYALTTTDMSFDTGSGNTTLDYVCTEH